MGMRKAWGLCVLVTLSVVIGYGGDNGSDLALGTTTVTTTPDNASHPADPLPLRSSSPVLLLFHGGAFLFGDPTVIDRAATEARSRGFKTVQVAYPLGDPERALRVARQTARRYPPDREVYVYGESAGGALAGRLVQARRLGIDGAALYSPTVDTTALIDQFADATRLPLMGHRVRAPTLALVAKSEATTPTYARGIRQWARADQRVMLRRVPGDHLGSGGEYMSNMRGAIRWLAGRAR